MELPTVEIAKPELPSPLPTAHQDLMNLFYGHYQALAAKVRDNNRALHEGCDEIFVAPSIPGMMRSPRQSEIAQVMPSKVNAAVLLGNLNYQVENGGFRQHADNGYIESVDAIITLFEGAVKVGVDSAKDVLDIVQAYAKRARDGEGGSDAYRFGRLFANDDEEDAEPAQAFGDLDERYYDLPTETIMQAVLDRFDEIVAHSFMAGAYRKAA